MCEQSCNKFMSDQINELASALSKAQGEIQNAKKESENPFFKSKYADLSAIMDAIKSPFLKNGLSYTQLAESENGYVKITTILMHSSGQWVKGTLPLKPIKEDPQSYGSAITYGRRYSLQSIAGISADEDDDGNAASKPKNEQKKSQKQTNNSNKSPKRQMADALIAEGLTDVDMAEMAMYLKSMDEKGILTNETMLDVANKTKAYVNEWREYMEKLNASQNSENQDSWMHDTDAQ